jgi:hypothetical protein
VLYFVAGDREMNAKVKALSEQARKLTPEERIELLERDSAGVIPG